MNGKREGPSTSLTAAALQDHLSRQLALSQPALPRDGARSRRPRERRGAQQLAERVRQCASVRREAGSSGGERRERVLDAAPPPLSLAQRMGLVERPREPLSSREWGQIKALSRQRQDSALPCPICREEFGAREQVLLSCSHVFHRQCLKSVERFSGSSKTCPLCRSKHYQTRVIYDGETFHRNKAATIVQSWWRGVRVRRWYDLYRESVPPSQPSLRNKYYQKKLKNITSQMVDSCNQSRYTADSVLAAADSALEMARATMRILDYHSNALTAVDWPTLHGKAIETLPTAECPICISHLLPPQAPPTGHTHPTTHRPISLLSCGHLFHHTCLSSLEQHCSRDSALPFCPLCRAPYIRQPLKLS